MKDTRTNTTNIQLGLLLGCLVLGLFLRLGNPFEISFINDELSTWSKVNYDQLSDLIDNIKAVDSHPVGMYVFVYYWTLLFGTDEWLIKLPFFCCSFLSMYGVFHLACRWFSKNAALIILAYFVSMQFPIWWSGIARQYQSGLFCVLLMVHFWTRLLIEKQDKKRYWLGFVLAGAACMYNHYFSLLFAAVVGLSGLFWLRKSILLKYVFSGFGMLILFAPHWSITEYQLLNADGHLWYEIPGPSFFWNHLRYLFHYSNLNLLLLLAIVLYSFRFKVVDSQQRSLRKMALCWFLFPLLFGYWYSVNYSPILRTSHLLFSFPFLLFFLMAPFNKSLTSKHLVLLVLTILCFNCYSLVVGRKHFQTMNSHPYEHFVVQTDQFLKTHPASKVAIVLGENPEYIDYYKNYHQANFEYVSSFKPAIFFQEFKHIIVADSFDYLIVGNMPEAHYRLAFDLFPYVHKKSMGVNYEYYILSKHPKEGNPLAAAFLQKTTFNPPDTSNGWQIDSAQVRYDQIRQNYYFQTASEWGPSYQTALDFLPHPNFILDISMDVQTSDSIKRIPGAVLVLEISKGTKIQWKGVEVHQQTTVDSSWQRLYISTRFAHEKFYKNVQDYKIKTYFWNREKRPFRLDNFRISFRAGNPILYGDTNEFIP